VPCIRYRVRTINTAKRATVCEFGNQCVWALDHHPTFSRMLKIPVMFNGEPDPITSTVVKHPSGCSKRSSRKALRKSKPVA
jgi:hypothetical protein